MDGSSTSRIECSRAWPSNEEYNYNQEKDEDSSAENMSKAITDGGSSSNSTIEETDHNNINKSSSVRPYVRSKTPRLRWTTDLHLRFVQAVERLGGQERATPKLVLQLMNVKGLNIAHVKSHLQMHRSKKIDDPNQAIANNRNLVDYGGQNIYNLSQLPMLQSYNQSYNPSTFRYGHGSWNTGRLDRKWMQNVYNMSGQSTARPRFYDSVSEKIPAAGRNSTNICEYNVDHVHSSSSEKKGAGLLRSMYDHSLVKLMEFKSSKKQQEEKLEDLNMEIRRLTPAKRKVSACDQIDLNLSLGVKRDLKDEDDDDDDEYLSLSLCSPPSWKKLHLKLVDKAEESNDTERASTLDLTI